MSSARTRNLHRPTFAFGPQVCADLAGASGGAYREWLVADGAGGFASGTVSGLRTRRYHGLLVVPAAAGGRNVGLVSGDGRTYPLQMGSTVIGRGDQANLRLPDVGISRRHARLDYDGSQVVLTDLGSTNGTMVNGQRVSAVALNPGDMIQLGTTTLTFRVDG